MMNVGKPLVYILFLIGAPFKLQGAEYFINLPEPIESTSANKKIIDFFNSVYAEVDIQPIYIYSPAKRGFTNLHRKKIQAEGYRAGYIGETNVGVEYRIDVPLARVKVGVFCIYKYRCTIQRGQNYAIQASFQQGQEICRALDIKCQFVKGDRALAKLLERNMVDAVISPFPAYESYLCRTKQKTLFYKALPAHSFTIHHYTNLKSAALRQKITQAIVGRLRLPISPFRDFSSEPNLERCAKLVKSAG
ncbi:hypothetical protein [Alteromonas sp. ASW11-130]|uniref:hypothetical protein n=1 Tax=Alteromonas sp. ASW11-130 TaxID=3015775 RepID=UPI00224211C0|nr:hypothetical protein [Alteromonas sp. ASW11-130]MCW8091912.1 hypothetical protein [Alteromonas sp. ASW11-130]